MDDPHAAGSDMIHGTNPILGVSIDSTHNVATSDEICSRLTSHAIQVNIASVSVSASYGLPQRQNFPAKLCEYLFSSLGNCGWTSGGLRVHRRRFADEVDGSGCIEVVGQSHRNDRLVHSSTKRCSAVAISITQQGRGVPAIRTHQRDMI